MTVLKMIMKQNKVVGTLCKVSIKNRQKDTHILDDGSPEKKTPCKNIATIYYELVELFDIFGWRLNIEIEII